MPWDFSEQCFSGDMDRDCSRCSHSPLHDGPCCFGNPYKYDPNDEDNCQQCVHEEDCRDEAYFAMPEPERPRKRRRVTVRTKKKSPSSGVDLSMDFEGPKSSLRVLQPDEILEDEDEPLLHYVGRRTLWGMLTGALKTLTHDVEHNPPRRKRRRR